MRFRHITSAALLALWAPVAADAASVTLPRAGQIGIGLQGQFGTLASSGVLGDAFDSGAGYAVRLRYRMRYARALGLSFESQNFDAAVDSDADTAFQSLRLVTSGVELYQFSDPRERTQRYLCVGLGLYQSSIKQVNKEIFYLLEPDGYYASAGAGFERFFWRNWAFELSGRYLSMFNDGTTNHNFQASAGLVFYASY
jgi:hypothetical protein